MALDTPFPSEIISPVNPTPVYRDRGTVLTVFGIIQILLGLFAALMVPLVLIGAAFSRKMNGGGMPLGYNLLSASSYLFAAVVLITLGIGSIQAKRWARDLCLILSWVWLIFGTLTTILLTVLLPSTFLGAFKAAAAKNPQAATLPAGCSAVLLTFIIVFCAIFAIVLPLILLLFYRKSDVRETCRQRDPVKRWTEQIPLPLLAASLLFGFGALYYGLTGIAAPFFPFFGRYLTGLPAGIACLTVAFIDFVLAVLFFKKIMAGWWLAILDVIVRGAAIGTTIGRANLLDAYARMGMSSQQLQMMQASPFYSSGGILWWSLFYVVLFLGYLIWLRRYFVTSNTL